MKFLINSKNIDKFTYNLNVDQLNQAKKKKICNLVWNGVIQIFACVVFHQDIEEGLKAKGHEVSYRGGMSVVQAIDVTEDGIVGTADFRKGGEPRGL